MKDSGYVLMRCEKSLQPRSTVFREWKAFKKITAPDGSMMGSPFLRLRCRREPIWKPSVMPSVIGTYEVNRSRSGIDIRGASSVCRSLLGWPILGMWPFSVCAINRPRSHQARQSSAIRRMRLTRADDLHLGRSLLLIRIGADWNWRLLWNDSSGCKCDRQSERKKSRIACLSVGDRALNFRMTAVASDGG